MQKQTILKILKCKPKEELNGLTTNMNRNLPTNIYLSILFLRLIATFDCHQNCKTFCSISIGSFPSQGITSEQRAIYLPVMKALLKVMSTKRPAAQDINNLLIVTRELNKKVPKGQNLLGNFGSGDLNFGVDDLESMGLPETGDLIITVKGTPHIKTTFGE